MKTVDIVMALLLASPAVAAAGGQSGGQAGNLVPGPFECRLVEVSIQGDAGVSGSTFHCIQAPGNPATQDGLVLELHGLPREFETDLRRISVSGEIGLRVSNFLRNGSRITFTEDTTWQFTQR